MHIEVCKKSKEASFKYTQPFAGVKIAHFHLVI